MKARGRPPMIQYMLLVSAVLAVLFGVLLMHSLPLAHPANGQITSAHAPGNHDAPEAAVAPGDTIPALGGMGYQAGCNDNAGMHLCLAVVAIAAALVVARWHVTSTTGESSARGQLTRLRSHANRAPPWTTPTLAQLSVLRV